MENPKVIWNNDQLRSGGFYELSIEVSISENKELLRDLIGKLFLLDFIKGPFDYDFIETELDLEYFENLGVIEIDQKQVPFKTYYIQEEGGISWLDISIYSSIYEKILGCEYQTWSLNPKWHKGFDNLLIQIAETLNSFRKIRLGLIGFEISAMYNLEYLEKAELLKNDTLHAKFLINQSEKIKENNWKVVYRLKKKLYLTFVLHRLRCWMII